MRIETKGKKDPGKQPLNVQLDCPTKLLRVSRSIQLTAKLTSGNYSTGDCTFSWSVDEGKILPGIAVNEAVFTAPNRKCSVKVKVKVTTKDNLAALATVSIAIFKQLAFLKADDMHFDKETAIHPNWEKFLDYMEKRRVKACIGLICISLDRGNKEYFNRLREIEPLEFFELFNHGYDHAVHQTNEQGEEYYEFYNTSLAHQRDHLKRSQRLAKEKLNLTLHTFGAPGNKNDHNTTIAMEEIDDLSIWFLGDPESSKLVLDICESIEFGTGLPDYDRFVRQYSATDDYMVLHLHPKYWNNDNFDQFVQALNFLIDREVTFLLPSEYLELAGSYHHLAGPPEIALSHQNINFGCDSHGHCTPPQIVRIENSGKSLLNWQAVSTPIWLNILPTEGIGNSEISVSIILEKLTPGLYNESILIEDPAALNSPQEINVSFEVFTRTKPPFGGFDTPVGNTIVSGSIAVTGWALDDIGIKHVKIYSGDNFIGDAPFTEGTRPDIEKVYPGYPRNYQAGWGYMCLTNCLPGGGNGTYTLTAVATDLEGNEAILGTKTITVDNKNAVKPFGAIDTPVQGGTVSGKSFVNWGWALAPLPARIPEDGSTIHVFVDGVDMGNPVYNIYRSDIAKLFPDYVNSQGAIGFFVLDTTKFSNGRHTISWRVKDSAGNAEGIGSRYFFIQN